MIKDGIIQHSHIKGIQVTIDLIPEMHYNRPAYQMDAESITIHETGNMSTGAGAKSHAAYIKKVTTKTSWHYTVDDKEIYQHLPINENAWHAGDGSKGKGNRSSIAIEICVNIDGDFEKAKENAKKLIQYLMKETGIETVIPHKNWSGKECPRKILNSGWKTFIDYVMHDYDSIEIQMLKNELQFYKDKLQAIKEFIEEAQLYGL